MTYVLTESTHPRQPQGNDSVLTTLRKDEPVTHRPADARDQLEETAPPNPPASPAVAASDGASTPALAQAPPPSKFTVLLDPDAAINFDQLALDIRRLLGRRVSKGDLVRALIDLAAADLTVRDQLLDELRAGTQRDDIPVTAATRKESDRHHTEKPG